MAEQLEGDSIRFRGQRYLQAIIARWLNYSLHYFRYIYTKPARDSHALTGALLARLFAPQRANDAINHFEPLRMKQLKSRTTPDQMDRGVTCRVSGNTCSTYNENASNVTRCDMTKDGPREGGVSDQGRKTRG